MNLSIIDKLGQIFGYMFSSFMTIQLSIIAFLLFGLIILNIKRDTKVIKIASCFLFLIIIISLILMYQDYAINSINTFIKWILNYLYFPSMAMYFMTILFVTGVLIVTIISKKMSVFLKRVNLIFFGVIYFMYINVISITLTNGMDLTDIKAIYEHNTLLSFIQISNMIFFLWIEFILVYNLYQYFKRKYD